MKQYQMKIFMALAGIIISLIVVELGLRLLGIEYPLFYDYDPYIGHKLRAGVKGYYLKEGRGYVSINSDGLRDHENLVTHPANTLRIVVLGDSYAEAMQVNEDEAFWAIMSKELQRCDNLRGRNIEVINFGVSGFGTAQELLALRHKAWKYSPDVVVLAFTSGNDVSDNSRMLKQVDYYPYPVYQGNKLILDNRQTREHWLAMEKSFARQIVFRWGISKLRVFQVINYGKDLFGEWWTCQDFRKNADGQEAGLSASIYREPTTEVWKEAWKVTEGVLLQMRDEVVEKGAQFFVVTVTTGIQVDPDVSKRLAFARQLEINDLFYAEHRLEGFCQNQHIPILLLGPPFQQYATQHQVFLHGFGKTLGSGHWNKAGHRLAGEFIAKWLCSQLK